MSHVTQNNTITAGRWPLVGHWPVGKQSHLSLSLTLCLAPRPRQKSTPSSFVAGQPVNRNSDQAPTAQPRAAWWSALPMPRRLSLAQATATASIRHGHTDARADGPLTPSQHERCARRGHGPLNISHASPGHTGPAHPTVMRMVAPRAYTLPSSAQRKRAPRASGHRIRPTPFLMPCNDAISEIMIDFRGDAPSSPSTGTQAQA
jgi:hypothetical protein